MRSASPFEHTFSRHTHAHTHARTDTHTHTHTHTHLPDTAPATGFVMIEADLSDIFWNCTHRKSEYIYGRDHTHTNTHSTYRHTRAL